MCTTALSSDWPKPNLLIEQRHRMKIELRSMFVSCLTSLYAWHFVLEFQANWIVCLWHVSYFVHTTASYRSNCNLTQINHRVFTLCWYFTTVQCVQHVNNLPCPGQFMCDMMWLCCAGCTRTQCIVSKSHQHVHTTQHHITHWAIPIYIYIYWVNRSNVI